MVRILDYIPTVYIELKYATTDNFTGKIIYDFTDASLRYGTIKKLKAVQEELPEKGYSLKIWDAYRPVNAQFALWDVCPNPVTAKETRWMLPWYHLMGRKSLCPYVLMIFPKKQTEITAMSQLKLRSMQHYLKLRCLLMDLAAIPVNGGIFRIAQSIL